MSFSKITIFSGMGIISYIAFYICYICCCIRYSCIHNTNIIIICIKKYLIRLYSMDNILNNIQILYNRKSNINKLIELIKPSVVLESVVVQKKNKLDQNTIDKIKKDINNIHDNEYMLTDLNSSEIPSEVWNLLISKKLTKLELFRNHLEIIPKTINKLTELDSFGVEHNELTELPDAICELTKLRFLYLYDNQLTTLPKSIGNLKELVILNISNNQLKILPESIVNLNKLERLNISANQLTTLPESIVNLGKLERLNISANQLTTLPKSIGNLSNLQTLDISTNELTTLPDTINKLNKLYRFWVERNKLTKLPDAICELIELQFLHLNDNKLETLPELIGNLKLFTLKISNNQLKTLPESIGKLTSILNIDLSHNPMEEKEKERLKKIFGSKLSM